MFQPQTLEVIARVDALRHQVDDHWQVPAVEAKLLAQLAYMFGARSALEIGVSYGFSTLHITAAVAHHGGHLHGIDISPKKIDAATRHLTEAGLIDHVTLHLGDAREQIARVEPQNPFDFVFIDATKDQSRAYLDAIMPRLAPRCAIVTDNTSTHPDQLGGFVEHLRSLPGFNSCDVPVGNGIELTVRMG